MGFNEKMTSIADKIRSLTGSTDKLNFNEMDTNLGTANNDKQDMIAAFEDLGITVEDGASLSELATSMNDEINGEVDTQANLISQISTALEGKAAGGGGIDTSDATAAAGDILSGKTAYVDGEKITGTIATKTAGNLTASNATVTVPAGYYASQVTKSVSTTTQATPTISVSSTGKITASATQTAGYVSAGTKSGTKQLTTQAAKTVTPSTSSQTAVSSGVYTTGTVTVGAIPSDYIVTDEIATQDNLISQIQTALEGKAAGGGSGGGNVETVDVYIKIADVYMVGLVISTLMYTSIENGVITNHYGKVDDMLLYTTPTGGLTSTGYYTGTLSCVVGTPIYLLDENILGPSFTTNGTTIESFGVIGAFAAPITSSTTSIIADAS